MSVFNELGEKLYNVIKFGGENCVEDCRKLIEDGANPNAVWTNNQTPLILASDLGRKDVVDLLLKKGANINAQDKYGFSPLIAASDKGHEEVVKLLLENNANTKLENIVNQTAANCAKGHGYSKIENNIIEKEREAQNTIDYNNDPDPNISFIQKEKKTNSVNNLELSTPSAQQLVETKNLNEGSSKFIEAKSQNNKNQYSERVNEGMIPNLDDKNTKHPISYLEDINPKIPKKQNNVNEVDFKGNTALMVAVRDQNISMIEYLIDSGADMSKENEKKETALTIAKGIAEDPNNENGKATLDYLNMRIAAQQFAKDFNQNKLSSLFNNPTSSPYLPKKNTEKEDHRR